MSALDRLLNRASRTIDLTPTEYVIVKHVHPKLRAIAGYYATHDRKVWHWVKSEEQATTFRSYELAQAAATGSMLDIYHYYKIERL